MPDTKPGEEASDEYTGEGGGVAEGRGVLEPRAFVIAREKVCRVLSNCSAVFWPSLVARVTDMMILVKIIYLRQQGTSKHGLFGVGEGLFGVPWSAGCA